MKCNKQCRTCGLCKRLRDKKKKLYIVEVKIDKPVMEITASSLAEAEHIAQRELVVWLETKEQKL